jgi:hypothetical protein
MASRQTAASKLLATRGRKIAAAMLAAFIASIGAGLGARALTQAESATRKALGGPDVPLQVHVMRPGTFPSDHPYAPYYIVPKSETSSPSELESSELAGDELFDFAFAERHGAVAGSPEIVRLQLRARGSEPVTIDDVKIRVAKREPPVDGWYVLSAGCGGLEVRTAAIDLDTPTPKVDFFDAGTPEKQLTLFVTNTNIEVLQLQASTESSTVDWSAEVFYSGPEGDGSVVVDDGGKPFRVTAETESDGYSLLINPTKLVREPSWDEGIQAC